MEYNTIETARYPWEPDITCLNMIFCVSTYTDSQRNVSQEYWGIPVSGTYKRHHDRRRTRFNAFLSCWWTDTQAYISLIELNISEDGPHYNHGKFGSSALLRFSGLDHRRSFINNRWPIILIFAWWIDGGFVCYFRTVSVIFIRHPETTDRWFSTPRIVRICCEDAFALGKVPYNADCGRSQPPSCRLPKLFQLAWRHVYRNVGSVVSRVFVREARVSDPKRLIGLARFGTHLPNSVGAWQLASMF